MEWWPYNLLALTGPVRDINAPVDTFSIHPLILRDWYGPAFVCVCVYIHVYIYGAHGVCVCMCVLSGSKGLMWCIFRKVSAVSRPAAATVTAGQTC